eukprot:6185155-Pleurochrysis_carterae.AAC.1
MQVATPPTTCQHRPPLVLASIRFMRAVKRGGQQRDKAQALMQEPTTLPASAHMHTYSSA